MLIFLSFICLLASGDSTDSAHVTCLFNLLLKCTYLVETPQPHQAAYFYSELLCY